MRLSYCLVVPVISVFLSGVIALNDLSSRALVDVCAQVDAELKIANVLGIPIAVGLIDACICLSALPLFIQTNVVAEAAVALFGQAKTLAALTALINGDHGSQHCTYPDHATPMCKAANPCFFTCADGFTASPSGNFPTSCVCNSPNTVCDGKCGNFPSCASAHARRAVSFWARDSNCQAGSTACPVPGRGRTAFECIDTMSDLESCGGCIYPSVTGPIGVDCTTIEGVSDVGCHHGRCVVNRCMPGYQIYGSLCLGDEPNTFIDASDVLAVEFGLEHVPF